MTVTTTLRPGLLVSLRTSITGNVSYTTKDLEREHQVEDGASRARWETVRHVKNKAELARAVKARHLARQAIASTCSRSSFGLLCPDAWAKSLYEGIAVARKVASDFNKTARCTELAVYVIVGRIAQDDVEAVRAINSEVRGLMSEMAAGIKDLDPKRVREAASRAKSIAAMVTPEAQERIKGAIEAARAAARKIVKAGEEAGKAVDKEAIKAITQSRTAFLDLDAGEVLPTEAPKAAGRAVDLAPKETSEPKQSKKVTKAVNPKARAEIAKPRRLTAQLELDGLSNAALEPAVRAIKAARGKKKAAA